MRGVEEESHCKDFRLRFGGTLSLPLSWSFPTSGNFILLPSSPLHLIPIRSPLPGPAFLFEWQDLQLREALYST